jgi:membrane-associated phospholipid phosphatase
MLPVRPRGWWADLALLAAFAALTAALASGHLLALDVRVAGWVDGHRPPPLYRAARALNYLGQGGLVLTPVSVVLAALVAWRRRSVRPALVVVAAFLLTSVTIGPLKIWLDRAAPHFAGPDRAVLFNPHASGGAALSYPSGHVANALVWYGVIALLVSALLRATNRPPPGPRAAAALRVLPPLAVFCSTTYLGFHWLSDSVAGLLLGLVLTRLLARVRWDAVPLPDLPAGWDRAALAPPRPDGPVRGARRRPA